MTHHQTSPDPRPQTPREFPLSKLPYQKPQLVRYGKVQGITQGTSSGIGQDAAYSFS